jgi:TP901 family phage tail tape measure protein
LGTSGLSVAESLKALPVVANFAMASNMSLEKATTLLTQAQTALGLRIRTDSIANMQEMARVADLLVAADQRVAGSAQQFAEALTNKAAAALNLVNKSAEEGVAVLAKLAEQGIVGAKAGDFLYRALRDLETKAVSNKSVFEKLGISVFNVATGQMLPMGPPQHASAF